jgi:hypothetical protein
VGCWPRCSERARADVRRLQFVPFVICCHRMGDRGWGRGLLLTLPLAIVCALPAAALAATFHWSAPTTIDGGPFTETHAVTAASCPTASLCVAGDDHGDILTSNAPNGGAGGWHATRQVDPPSPFSAISCPSQSLCVAVSQSGDVATSTHPTAGAGAWRVTHGVAGPSVALLGVSCPTVSLCVAIDANGGVVASTHPTAGQRAWKRTSVIPARRSDPLTGIACPSRSECVAVDTHDQEVAHSGRPGVANSWSVTSIKAPRTGENSPSIACGSPKLCVIVGTNNDIHSFVVTSTDPLGGRGAWTATGHLPKQTGYLFEVTCPAATFCAATGYESPVIYTTSPRVGGSSWKASYSPSVDDDNGPVGVACQSSKLCVAFDPVGNVITSAQPADQTSWTVSLVDQVNSLDALDCASASFCVAGGSGGRLETSANPAGGAADWSQSTLTLSPTTIDCPAISLCVASGDEGDDGLNIDASTDPAAGAGSWKVAQTGGLGDEVAAVGDIACPTVSFCVEPYYQVEDDSDLEATNVLHSTAPAGGLAAWSLSGGYIDGGVNGGHGPGDGRVAAFSCAATSLCAGVDDGGRVLASATPAAASSWKAQQVDAGRSMSDISCAPSSTTCVAVDSAGDVVTTSQPLTGLWKVAHIDPVNALTAIDCPSAHLCVAVDGSHNAFTTTHPTGGVSAWKRVSGIDGDLNALSCPTTTVCLAVDGDGGVIVGHP